MFETRGSAAFATMGDLKNRLRETIEKAKERPVYLLRDGKPVGGLVSMGMMQLLQDALEAAAARANGMKGGRPRKQGMIESKKKAKDLRSGARSG